MIIPVKCFTCGKVLADKWIYYRKQITERSGDQERNLYLNKPKDSGKIEKSIEGKILDELKLTRICCRRHMLTHVDIE